jgi:hypothetical protein
MQRAARGAVEACRQVTDETEGAAIHENAAFGIAAGQRAEKYDFADVEPQRRTARRSLERSHLAGPG